MALSEKEIIEKLGPLAAFVGIWEGAKGDDLAPDDSRKGTENNKYRERMSFVPFGPTNNHEQELWGLRYSTTAWRLSEADPFHEDVGYYLWDPKEKQVMRCFVVPRGIAVIAGGTVEPAANSFTLKSELGSSTYGICSNKFLDREFQTVSYELAVSFQADGSMKYRSNTRLKMKGREKIFDHTDENVLQRRV